MKANTNIRSCSQEFLKYGFKSSKVENYLSTVQMEELAKILNQMNIFGKISMLHSPRALTAHDGRSI